jgi:hypothetical protein
MRGSLGAFDGAAVVAFNGPEEEPDEEEPDEEPEEPAETESLKRSCVAGDDVCATCKLRACGAFVNL